MSGVPSFSPSPSPGAARTASPDIAGPSPDRHTFATPLRAVDRIEVLAEGPVLRFLVHKTVDPGDPYMVGHFPGLTLLPAVFVLEALRQATTTLLGADEPLNPVEVRSGRWLAPMQGGDEIRLDVTVKAVGVGRWSVTADGVRHDGTPVAAVRMVLGNREAAEGSPPAGGSSIPAPVSPTPLPPGPDYTGILDLLPVRHPMLLVDRVETLDPGRRITTVKAVSGSEPCYGGMAEGLPLSRYTYPRTLMLESFGQSSVLLWLSTGTAEGVPVAAAFRDCRFTGEVRPGAVLRHVARIDRLMANNVFVSGQTWDGDRCVMTVGALIGSSRPRARVDRTMAGTS